MRNQQGTTPLKKRGSLIQLITQHAGEETGQFLMEGKRETLEQFIEILDLTIISAFLGSVIMTILHYFSEEKGSWTGYLMILYCAFCFMQKQICLSTSNVSVLPRIRSCIQSNRMPLYLMVFTLTITECMIFESPHYFAFSPMQVKMIPPS